MQLTPKDIESLRSILAACKVVGIDGVVIHEGMARGAKPSLDAAIISQSNLSISEALKIGIGRVGELDKRLSIFPPDVSIEGKSSEAGDVTLLTMAAGKTKMQFRCTSVALMRYPKSNEDPPLAVVSLSKAEISQLSKAARTLSAETVVLQVSRTGIVKLECVDSANDRFDIELAKPVEFIEEAESSVQTYLAGLLVDLLDAAAKSWAEDVDLVLGHGGSITTSVKGHTLLIFPQITGDD